MQSQVGLGSITMNKASEGDGIPVELFQILKVMLWKCCTQYASKFGKLSSGHRTGKGVFIPIPKEGNAKEFSNYYTIALIHTLIKIMLKILQASLQQYVNWELPNVQSLKRQRNQRSNCQYALNHRKKQESSRKKKIYFCFIDYLKAFDCVDHNKL